MNIREAIRSISDFIDLNEDQARDVAFEIMSGEATPAQIGALLIGLNMKRIVISEITGFAKTMIDKAQKVEIDYPDIVDTVGTGGDNAGTFNISTVSAMVAAGAGCKVIKHGNRASSSKCGSADLLEALGIGLDLTPDQIRKCAQEAGMAFLYAPNMHPAMKYAAYPRKEIGIRTIFNILGPLTNPAGAKRQVLGVYEKKLVKSLAMVLKKLGFEHALVVHGEDGLDEITLTGKTEVAELVGGGIQSHQINPEEFGFTLCQPEDLVGGDAQENADIALKILEGGKGPHRDIVLLNAGATIYVSGKAGSLEQGIEKARESIDKRNAMQVLLKLRELTA